MLVEETPALDTYEARQRGRLIVGVLVAGCVGIFGWIFYNLFIYYPGTEKAHTNPTRQRGECLRALAGASG